MAQQVDFDHAIDRLTQRLAGLATGPVPSQCLQLVEPCASIDLLPWLASQTAYPKIFWRDRDQRQSCAALGAVQDHLLMSMPSAAELDKLYSDFVRSDASEQLRLYGGVAFDPQQPAWPAFGQARFVLPRIELRQTGQQTEIRLTLAPADWATGLQAAQAALLALSAPRALAVMVPLRSEPTRVQPNWDQWQQLVAQVTDPRFNIDIPKVVLARASAFEDDAVPDPWALLASWGELNPHCYQYGFQFSQSDAFISASPERLYRRAERGLSTEALAGTTVRGQTLEEDQQLAQALLHDKKNCDENQLVRQHIEQQLMPLSEYVGAEEVPTILKLRHIQHLHRDIQAELKAGVNDLQLLQALHPTPAVGGLPRDPALQFIRQHEGVERGWYAGACGYLGATESEFSVAIRSAHFQAGKLTLFAGAGIVADSDPKAEWQELNNKLTTVLGILKGL